MAKENDFSFNENEYNEKVNNEYLDLLSETEVDEEEIQKEVESRDIYSSSLKEKSMQSFKDDYEDVYSDSSDDPDDIYTISNEPEEYEDVYSNGDIYLSKIRKSKEDYEKDYEDIPINSQKKPVSPTAIRNPKMNLEDDEISDYEAKRGKLVKDKKNNANYSKLKKGIAIVLAVIIAFGVVLITSASSIVNNFTKGEKVEHIADESSLNSRYDVTNILFIGADNANGGTSRSDSMMIISVNKRVGKIIVTSILRDVHVDIPGECDAKINSAYSWGGANLLIQTIEQNFNIKIDGYAVVDFNMFTELVDGLGGIDIEVTEAEANYINYRHKYGGETRPDFFESGESVHLNGYQALWYSRIRKLDSDFMRTYRQRKVITAIAENVKTELLTGNIFGLISTAKDVAPNVETSLSSTEFTSLIMGIISCVLKSGLDTNELLVSQQLPFDGTWWSVSKWDGDAIALNLSENRQLLYESIYEPNFEKATEGTTNE